MCVCTHMCSAVANQLVLLSATGTVACSNRLFTLAAAIVTTGTTAHNGPHT